MQYRMKTHQLNEEQIALLLAKTQTASLATVNSDGTPYVTPIHFIHQDGHIYFHGLPAGQKVENIKANPTVSFAAYDMESLLYDPDEKPCDTNTKYHSVILQGTASFINDVQKKEHILRGIVQKYTPHLSAQPLPSNMVNGTAVVQIDISEITGKYYG